MKNDPLKIQSHVILGMLILQYFFGMAVNLFIQFPTTRNEKILWKFAVQQLPLLIHMILGVLVVIGGIVLLIRSVSKKDKKWIWAASIGLFFLLVASLSGSQFISTQQNGYSFMMSVAFIFAFTVYGWGIYKAQK